jgi:phenylpropionate dioxygenase-like ring-hydroxylating dioxygenase large terminal subunit
MSAQWIEQALADRFDIGFGPTAPDAEIMRTGRVPASAYTSSSRFEVEREIFRHVWLHIGQAKEIPNPGDWMVREVKACSASILLVRGKDQRVRAFHNICSHRGLKLAWGEKGCAHQFVCPYHAWVYGSDGALRNIPDREAFPHVDPVDSGLTPIAVDEWEGFLFVNLDPAPRLSLADYLGPVATRLAGAPFGEYTLTARLSGVVKANWKLVLEAQSEGYHVQSLHRLTVKEMSASAANPHMHLNDWEALGAHRTSSVPTNTQFTGFAKRPMQNHLLASTPQLVVTAGSEGVSPFRLSEINRPASADWGAEQFSIFPNFCLNVAYNGFWSTQAWPISVDSSVWEATYYFREPASRQEQAAAEATVAFNRDTLSEDNICTVHQQAALASGGKSHIYMGENEMSCRHEAAVIEAVLAGIAARQRAAA